MSVYAKEPNNPRCSTLSLICHSDPRVLHASLATRSSFQGGRSFDTIQEIGLKIERGGHSFEGGCYFA